MATKKKPVKTKEDSQEKKYRNWEQNQDIISTSLSKLIIKHKKIPTLAAIAKDCNLSERTIARHFKEKDFIAEQREKLKGMNDMMLAKFTGAVYASRSHQLWRLWFEITDPEFRKKRTDITTNGESIKIPTVIVPGDDDDN